MKKVFGIIALAVAVAACSKNAMAPGTVGQTGGAAGGITITATLAPKTGGTKAVTESGGNIVVDWAENEHLAILYQVSSTKYATDATITAVDGEGKATITFTVVGSTPDNTPCTIVYPLSAAKDDHSGVKDAATLLAAQDGTLNANLDVRVGAGTIRTATPSLEVSTQPAAQFAIFKFMVRLYDGTTAISPRQLTITIGTQGYVITPATATDVLYAALPAVDAQKVSFDATDGSNRTYTCAKASTTFSAGYYYQSTLKMREYVLMGEGHNLKWATCNVGADNPQDYGNYYAWGEIAPKSIDYVWSNYAWAVTNYDQLTKYCSNSSYGNGGFTDTLTELVAEDDAASVNWQSSWRIPTLTEWNALLDNTNFDRVWTENYNSTGINGLVITSKVSGYVGNSIFFPAAGDKDHTPNDAGDKGSYWSSTLHTTYPNNAYYFISGSSYTPKTDYHNRCHGRPVRAVAN